MTRFCASCGTEVDESAVFCPTCGQPIDEADESAIPPAPAWPDAAPEEGVEPPPAEAVAAPDEPTRVEERPARRAPSRVRRSGRSAAPASPAPPDERVRDDRSAPNLPITMPVTLSAWLIGVGSAVAAVGVIISLFGRPIDVIDLLLVLALAAIAISVFFAAALPAIANLRLVTLVIVLIAFGMALDRIGLGRSGVGELLLFLGTAAAAIGAVLLELGRDQPLGGAGT
jgi:hypothetical protein